MKKVIIIGAGPAGLTVALELLHKAPDQYDITILEESGAIGGISRTVQYHGNRMDIGGHRFFSKDNRVMDWWKARMPLQGAPSMDDRLLHRESPLAPGGPNPDTTDRVMLVRHRISRIYYLKKFFDYPVRLKWQTLQNLGFFRTLKVGFSYLRSLLLKRPEDSLENFYINRFGKTLYSMFFEDYTAKVWGRHPREISADWGAQRVKGLSIVAMLKDIARKALGRSDDGQTETSLIEQFWYPKYGPGQLWEQVAREAEELGASLCLHHKVTRIHTQAGRVTSVVCDTPDGPKTFEGDYFFSSMPLKDLMADMPEAEVPQDVQRIAQGLPYRDFVTVGLLVPRLCLVNETSIPTLGNIVPDCWIYVQETHVKLGRIQIFNNWSPYMVKDPEHTVWIGLEYFCQENDAFWNLSDQECIQLAAKELVSMGILGSADDVIDSHREKVKKAYPAYFDTYSEIHTLIQYLDTYPNLYCIGRNGQHRYNNMDHSMLSAMEAVDCLLSGSTDHSRIWNVNTEKSYHESK